MLRAVEATAATDYARAEKAVATRRAYRTDFESGAQPPRRYEFPID